MTDGPDKPTLLDSIVSWIAGLMDGLGLNGTRLRWKWRQRRFNLGEDSLKAEMAWRSARARHKMCPECRALVDRFVDVDEAAIEQGMQDALRHQHLLVEGAVGVAIAACRADRERRGQRVAVVVCGGNLPFELVQRLVAGVIGRPVWPSSSSIRSSVRCALMSADV